MNEFWRKAVHLIFGVLITLLIWVVPKEMALMILGAGLLVGLGLIDLTMRGIQIPLISLLLVHLERKGSFPGKGAFFFVFASLVTLLFFPSQEAAIGVLVLSVLDGAATIIGLRYGRIRIINRKSIEGSLGAILITILVLIPLMTPVQAIIISIIAGIVELASPIDDNLVIPLVVAYLVTRISI